MQDVVDAVRGGEQGAGEQGAGEQAADLCQNGG
jgi:hypothetical protein